MLSATPHAAQGSVARWKGNRFSTWLQFYAFVKLRSCPSYIPFAALCEVHPYRSCNCGWSWKSVSARLPRVRNESEGCPASLVATLSVSHAHALGGVVSSAAQARKDRATHVAASSTAAPQASRVWPHAARAGFRYPFRDIRVLPHFYQRANAISISGKCNSMNTFSSL